MPDCRRTTRFPLTVSGKGGHGRAPEDAFNTQPRHRQAAVMSRAPKERRPIRHQKPEPTDATSPSRPLRATFRKLSGRCGNEATQYADVWTAPVQDSWSAPISSRPATPQSKRANTLVAPSPRIDGSQSLNQPAEVPLVVLPGLVTAREDSLAHVRRTGCRRCAPRSFEFQGSRVELQSAELEESV